MGHRNRSWAIAEFGDADLNDSRLTKRLVLIARRTLSQRGGNVASIIPEGAEREAAYRFLENEKTSVEAVTTASANAALDRFVGDGWIVIVLDQSSLSMRDPHDVRGLGAAGSKDGNMLRSVQVITGLGLDENGHVLGIFAQEFWNRGNVKLLKSSRRFYLRESARWVAAMQSAHAVIHARRPHQKIVFVMDRGGDSYGIFNAAKALGVDVLIRHNHGRRTANSDTMTEINAEPVVGKIERKIREHNDDGTFKRMSTARFHVRSKAVDMQLFDSASRRGSCDVNVVQLKSARRRDPILWTMLTTLPATTLKQLEHVIDLYCARWRIEDFHRTWKRGGYDVEKNQLRSYHAITLWAAILAAVAARAERLKTLSRAEPDRPARDEFSEDELRALKLLSGEKRHQPKDWQTATLGEVAILIAYYGGWGGKSQGPAGSTILARGLQRIESAAEVIRMMRDETSG